MAALGCMGIHVTVLDEKLNNLGFKPVEFDGFKKNATRGLICQK